MLNRLLGRKEEERAISFQTLFASGDSLYMTTTSGTPMDQRLSLEITTVYACVRLISDSISTMPMDTFIRVDGDRRPYRPRPTWLDYPDIGVTRIEHFQQVLVSLLLDGNAFVRINRREDGEVLGLSVLNPQKVQVHRDGSGQIYYTFETVARIDAADMLHITELRLPGELRGKSRIDLLKENLGLASALQEFAGRFFGNGSNAGGIIEWPGNLTKEQAKNLVEAFEEGHKGLRRSHRPGVLFGGATYKQTTVAPNDSQFLESRRFAVEEIARIFRCPPSMLGVTEPGASSYASVEANGIHFVMHTLRPYVQKLEEAYSRLLPGVAFFKINIDGLMRGDYASRVAGYGSGLQAGWLSINDVRRFEDLRPVDGGDTYRVPLANVDLLESNLGEIERKTAIA
ncbi:MAG: phage portal protein, partial [Ilumatobacteraceae bacterium]